MITIGSVKDLIIDDSPAGKLYQPPEIAGFGTGAWKVSGRFSVADLKEMIPETIIKNKAEALTMMVGAFYEWLAHTKPEVKTCYLGIADGSGQITNTHTLLDRGELSDKVVMWLAHTPKTYSDGNLQEYRNALASGKLLCGVADIESIFRKGFPLGSSVFEKIFKAVGKGDEYNMLSTYEEVVAGLNIIRFIKNSSITRPGSGATRAKSSRKSSTHTPLAAFLKKHGLQEIPDPGIILDEFSYDITTKFEEAGDRPISSEEAQKYSGLDERGYTKWTQEMFPKIALGQIDFCNDRGIINMDGKCEVVAYHRNPVLTDFACTIDENRLMIVYEKITIGEDSRENKEIWAIPSNKEIQRAIFRREGVYAAIAVAKETAENAGDINNWRSYLPKILEARRIDLREVAEYSCRLMEYATAEVANRILQKNVFETVPIEQWAQEFLPYASKISYQSKIVKK